jgi:hypothetical protein
MVLAWVSNTRMIAQIPTIANNVVQIFIRILLRECSVTLAVCSSSFPVSFLCREGQCADHVTAVGSVIKGHSHLAGKIWVTLFSPKDRFD